MKTISTQTQITPDGKLRLELQTGLPPGPAEVVIVVQSNPVRPAKADSLSGLLAGPETPEDEVMNYLRQLRRECTEASWELIE